MSITISSPATLLDMAELSGAFSRIGWAVAREMWSAGSSFALRYDGELIGLAGIYPLDESTGECWFNITPAASAHMLTICRAMKLTIRASGYREIVAVVGTDAGRRIARMIGLQFFETTELGEVWSWNFLAETGRQNSRSSRRKHSSAEA